MKVEEVCLRLVELVLTQPFENRWQRYDTWMKLLVELRGDGVAGVGECTAMETPYYSYETVETAWYIVHDYLAPLILAGPFESVEQAARRWDQISGHHEAKGAVECALWDYACRLEGVPLFARLGGQWRPLEVGGTVGICPTVDELVARVARAAEAGCARVRVKIRPGWDVEPLGAVRATLPDVALIADANCAYQPGDHEHLVSIDRFGLLALEQPYTRGCERASAALQARLQTPIAVDESIGSVRELEEMVRTGFGRVVNVKVGRVGGLAEAIRIHDRCAEHGVANFVGAKYEFGVGRWTNVALASLPNMTLPSDIAPNDHYYLEDLVADKVEFVDEGCVAPRLAPGIGTALQLDKEGVKVRRIARLTA